MNGTGQDIKKYWHLIVQKKFYFVAVMSLVITTGLLLSYTLPKKYEASSTVFIEKSVISDLFKGIAVSQSIEGRLKVLSHSLSSRSLLTKVIEDMDLDATADREEISRLISKFRKNTTVTVNGRDLFSIRYTDENPQLAKDYVNTLIQTYIEDYISLSRRESYSANRFISEQVEYFRKKIEEAEQKLAEFRQQEDFAAIADEGYLVNQIREAQLLLDDLQIQKNQLMARRHLIQQSGGGGASPGETLAALEARRNRLLLLYTEKYPEVVLLDAEIARTRHLMEEQRTQGQPSPSGAVTMQGALLGIELNALQEKEQQLFRTLEEKKKLLSSIPSKRKILIELERERGVFQNTYDQLVQRYGSSEVMKQMEIQDKADTFRVIDAAVLPTKPVSPDKVKFILMSLAAGLGLGFAAVYVLDWLDSSVKGLEPVQELGLPILAVIPQFTSSQEQLRERKVNLVLVVFVSIFLLAVGLILARETMEKMNIALEDLIPSGQLANKVAGVEGTPRNNL